MNRIEQLISDMEQYIDSCKTQAFSGNRKIIVDRGAVDDFLAELRMCMPEVIQRSEKIVSNKEAIISDAKNQAEKLLNDANEKTTVLIDEHEIVQQAISQGQMIVDQADDQAQQILDDAVREANAFKDSAINYTSDAMTTLRALYEDSIKETAALFQKHLDELNEQYQMIADTHDHFLASIQGSAEQEMQEEPESSDEDEE
ncbi:MAG: vacuolar family H+-ATPase subunit H [Lachnospiraceae bacterium]